MTAEVQVQGTAGECPLLAPSGRWLMAASEPKRTFVASASPLADNPNANSHFSLKDMRVRGDY